MQHRRLIILGSLVAALVIAFFLRSSVDPAKPRTPKIAEPVASATTTRGAPSGTAPGALVPSVAPARTSTKPASSTLVFEGKWGGSAGQLGHRVANESNPEAPAALAVEGDDVVVLDQVNGRVQRFRRGVPISTFATTETVQDVALAPNGKTVLLDRLTDKNVTIVGADGKVISEIPLEGKGIPEAADTTGVFADPEGVYVEREHGSVVKVADAEGQPDPKRPELPGRPTRDGKRVITAAIADAALGRCVLTAFDRATLEVAFAVSFDFSRPLLQILLLDSDTNGNVYVGAEGAREREDHTAFDAALMVMRFGPDGSITGRIELPAGNLGDETVRPLTIGDDGALYVMIATESGMAVSRHTF